MASFLTENEIVRSIKRIIKQANDFVCIVSPYLDIDDSILELMLDVNDDVLIFIVYGKKDLAHYEIQKLAKINGLLLFFMENLHAKCYCNESEMIIGSMNLYQGSKNNKEMAILLDKEEETSAFFSALKETANIVRESKTMLFRRGILGFFLEEEVETGYCIRCREPIIYASDTPNLRRQMTHCSRCYKIWASFYNFDYTENYCHRCGEKENTCKGKPLCWDCYKQESFRYSVF